MDRSPGSAPDHSGVVVPPPLVYVVFFLAAMAIGRFVPLPRLPIGVGRMLGAALALSGIGLSVWSMRRFWASGTSVVPIRPSTAIVIEGPYHFTRNPMYLGMLLVYVGAACWWGLVWPLLLAPVLVLVMNVAVIGREERYLTRKFGGEYQRYHAQVRRWI